MCAGLKLLQGLASNCTQLVGVLIIFVLTSSRQTRPEVGDLLVVIGEASLVLGELDVKTACSGFIRSLLVMAFSLSLSTSVPALSDLQ